MNCKPGDLVVLVRPKIPENAGAIGTVLGRSPVPEWDWIVEFCRPMKWINQGDSDMVGGVNDWQLQPIRGLPVTEHESEPIKESA